MSDGLEMGNKTITVRFEPELYTMIKNHEMSSSDIIRQGVRMFFHKEKENVSDWPNIPKLDEKQNIVNGLSRNSLFNELYESTQQSNQICDSIDDTLQIINKLKNEINQLDNDLESIIKEYNEQDNIENNCT